MKVAHLVSFGMGGADRNAFNIIRALQEKGQQVDILYTEKSIPKATSAHHYEGYEPPSRQKQFETLDKLTKINYAAELNDYGIDILHTHRSGEDLWLMPGLEELKTTFKIVETNFHGALRTRADVRVFPSQALLNKAGCQGLVIPNAIARPASTENLRAELGLEGKFVCGKIARPDPDIYSDTNLVSFNHTKTKDSVFIYVGPSPAARRDVERLDLEKQVIWLDTTFDEERLSKIYNTFDLLCHSNRLGETFGNTIAEAMIHGVPVIAAEGQSHNWPQAHQEFFVKHPELFIRQPLRPLYDYWIDRMRSDVELRHRVGMDFKAQAKKLYTADVVAEQYLKLYEEVLK